jgi:capsule biosynthesis phosphatase
MIYILLCGGIGSRYNKYSLPKPLNYIEGKHMIEFIIENIPSDEIYIIYNIFLDEYNFKEIVINKFKNKIFHFSCVEYLTRGAVETAYIGIQSFNNLININENIVFIDNDNLHDLKKLNENFHSNFIGYSIDETDKSNYSFIEIEESTIINIAEKQKISNKFCCGIYGFINASKFLFYSKMVIQNNKKTNHEFYFSELYKFIINSTDIKETIKPIFIEKTEHIGSYQEITNRKISLLKKKLRICFDLDNTLVTYPTIINDYTTVKPIEKNIELLNYFRKEGHEIIIYTARRMLTHKGNIGKVIKDIAMITINTLEKCGIEYDELIFGKPIADIYIDDKGLNPYINNISYFGFFNPNEDFLPNKIDTNKYNSIMFIDNKIFKTGPLQFIRGELYYYQNIPIQLLNYFPKLLKYNNIDEVNITIELEYVKGLPLFYLYKHKLITSKNIEELFSILNEIHSQKEIEINITDENLYNNYFEKIKKRFENKTDYYFEDSEFVYQEIIKGLNQYYSAEKVCVIHGDFWFSNIIMMYNDTYKLIDMKGQVDGVLTINGDKYYDYGKLYQSILGYDLVLNDIVIDKEYLNDIHNIFIEKCKNIGLNIEYLKYVTKSLIFGNFPFLDKPKEIKQKIWDLIKSII